jgi:heat shock protein HslJ
MRLRMKSFLTIVLAWAGLAACQPAGGVAPPGPTPSASASLLDTEWTLVELGGRPAPPGAEGRPGTLRLTETGASGFAGCNRFSAGYAMDGAALRFSAAVLTRMACSAGMELERDYTAALEAVRSHRLTTQGLELRGESGVVARFVAR